MADERGQTHEQAGVEEGIEHASQIALLSHAARRAAPRRPSPGDDLQETHVAEGVERAQRLEFAQP